MNGFLIDIHAHILPDIDDGARTIEEALQMAQQAVESGVRTIVATPHSPDRHYIDRAASIVEAKTRRLQYRLRREGIPLRVLPGMEIFVTEDTPHQLQDGLLLPLNGTRYALVEFRFSEDPDFVGYMLERIRHAHFIPVIAHPERYFCVQDTPQLVAQWRQEGCLTQLDKDSLSGHLGEGAAMASEWLLANGAVDMVASDAHNPDSRTTDMTAAVRRVEMLTSQQTVKNVFVHTPYRLLCDDTCLNGEWEET